MNSLSFCLVLSLLQSRELERLNGLRQSYIQSMTQRLSRRVSEGEESLTPDRREIQFLERNLEELSRAHKKVRGHQCMWRSEVVSACGSGGLPRARMHNRGRVFGLSVSLFVCLSVCLSTTFWPIQAF